MIEKPEDVNVPLIEVKGLSKAYSINGGRKQQVLTDVEFTVSGGMVAVVGESGSGKSTLLNILGGLDRDFEGSVSVNGTDLKTLGEKAADDHRKLRTGFIFQSFNLISTYTALENIMSPARMTDMPQKEIVEKAKRLIGRLGLSGFEDKRPSALSGGEKQRVAIARALMNDPDIILADEPTGALDRQNAEKLLVLLREIADEGTLVLIVTHSSAVAEHCDRIIRLEYGYIKEDGGKTPDASVQIRKNDLRPKNLDIVSAFHSAFRNILKNRTRNIMVSIGASVGIFAVILLLFLSGGISRFVKTEMYATGNPLLIEITKAPVQGIRGADTRRDMRLVAGGEPFTQEEYSALAVLPSVDFAETGSILSGSLSYSYGEETGSFAMLATTYSGYLPALTVGEMPGPGQLLLSEAMAEALLADGDFNRLVGQTISISYRTAEGDTLKGEYDICGVAEADMNPMSRFKAGFLNTDDLNILLEEKGGAGIQTVYLYAVNEKAVSGLKQAVTEMGFTPNRQEAVIERILSFINIVTAGLTGIASISLVVSGIMILVVLYISVVERTREIGTLRAIGARKSDIRNVFVAEGAILGLAGGVTGVVAAVLAALVFNALMFRVYSVMLININLLHMAVGIGLSLGVSVLASLVPSSRAAGLDPVEALRYE